MTFHTTDWPAEAKRIARAFGIEAECHFIDGLSGEAMGVRKVLGLANSTENYARLGDAQLNVEYGEHYRYFSLVLSFKEKEENSGEILEDFRLLCWADIYLFCDGSNKYFSRHENYTLALAKGLFHLGLLTPEIEAALQVSITNHLKIDWALEYRQKYS